MLFQLHARRGTAQFLNRELRQVAHLQQFRRLPAAGPGKIARRQNGTVRPDFDDRVAIADAQHESGNVTPFFNGVAPILVFIGVEPTEIVAQDVRQIPFPPVASLIGVQPVAQRLVGDLLHVDVQRRVNAQAALVNRRGSIRGFEIFPKLFEKIGREVVARILHV